MQLPGGTFVGYDEYVALMERCWVEKPADRPTFEQVCGLGWGGQQACMQARVLGAWGWGWGGGWGMQAARQAAAAVRGGKQAGERAFHRPLLASVSHALGSLT